MAKVTITIEDSLVGDFVKIDADPSFKVMSQMQQSGHELTPAHYYAMRVARAAFEMSRDLDKATFKKRGILA